MCSMIIQCSNQLSQKGLAKLAPKKFYLNASKQLFNKFLRVMKSTFGY